MLGIILQILKIIGIVLLLLLGFVLFTVIAVLFVPVRYRLKASAHPSSVHSAAKNLSDTFLQNDIKIEAGASWLFHFLHFSFRMCRAGEKGEGAAGFDAGELKEHMSCRLRILGIPVVDFLHPKEKKPKKEKRKNQQADKKTEPVSKSLSSLEQDAEESKTTQDSGGQAVWAMDDTSQNTKKESRLKQFIAMLKKLFEKIKHIKYTVIGFMDKLKKIAHKAQYYKDTLTGEETKPARDKAAALLKRVGRHIKPSVFRTELLVGTPDPAVMGDILAVFGLLIPVLGNTVTITPYFDRYAAELEVQMKGRMFVYVFLLVLWKLKFDADINRAWDLLKNPGL